MAIGVIPTAEAIFLLVLDKSPQLFPLLTYIKDHEMEEKSTYREKIVKYMREQRLSSRLTTLNIINTLLQEGLLLEEGVMNYQSNLKINPKYDFFELWAEMLYSEHSKINEKLKPLKYFIGADKLKRFSKDDKTWELFIEDKYRKVKTIPKIT